ncbi:glycosyltransferase [Ideonella sp. YS5]|uniref:glycosyltransferase n=1 Tax=Ideonella sp. YS5 TaxID=3453714 RepID=UPI003EEE2336
MHILVDREEGLWAECERLSSDPGIRESLLGGEAQAAQVLLAYAPVARRNQYQAMLYGQARRHGCHLLPLLHTELLGRIPWVGPVICHFHWLHGGTAKAADEAAADKAVDEFAAVLRRIRMAGHRVVWTVHNVMPHETRWPEHDRRIHQMVADAADVVHVMTSQSRALCSPHYRWDADKELCVPHPSYLGAHADWLSPMQARAEWRIAQEEVVFLSFGAVLGYKGYAGLMTAFDAARAASVRPLRLIIAGAPADEAVARALRLWAHGRSDVTLELRTIGSDEIQYFFRAADAAVCPYERTLNSGAALMATSFGVPVIGPRIGGFIDNIGESAGLLYDPADEAGLTVALIDAAGTDLARRRDAALGLARELRPERISDAFFAGLRMRLAFT